MMDNSVDNNRSNLDNMNNSPRLPRYMKSGVENSMGICMVRGGTGSQPLCDSGSKGMEQEVPLLVSTQWLRARLDDVNDQGNLLVIDTTWLPLADGQQVYSTSHIPGAVHFDLNACVQHTRFVPRNLPDGRALENYLKSLGVSKGRHLVLYDRDNLAKDIVTFSSSRVWWLLKCFGVKRVSVLDGGLLKWEGEGHPVTSGVSQPQQPGDIEHSLSTKFLRTFDAMAAAIEDQHTQIVDTRLPEHFTGSAPEPNPFTELVLQDLSFEPLSSAEIRGGHMPGSSNIPFPALLDTCTGGLKSRDDLLQMFDEVGVDLTRPVIASCYIGHSACALALAAVLCGCKDVSVYYGSWTEYGQRATENQCVKDD